MPDTKAGAPFDTVRFGALARRWSSLAATNPISRTRNAPPRGWAAGNSVDGIEGAIEVHLNKGDALVFVDAIMHGSARRTNPGQRRIAVYRYGPSWGGFRHGYTPSPELLARLTPERRQIVAPPRTVYRPQANPATASY
jgi:ectoine hydroxylase-related dioxygenase (phytanoyl-CoA dioxygenase family)